MRFGLLFLAILLVSCGSDSPVGGSDQPTGSAQPMALEALAINAKLDSELVTSIRPGGGLIVAGKSTRVGSDPGDAPISYPADLSQAAALKISKPLVNQCTVNLFLKLVSANELNFEIHTQWTNDVQKIDCWVFEAEMRQSGLHAILEQVKVNERDSIKSVGLFVTP